MNIELKIAGELNFTGFCDKEGSKIYIGNTLEFTDYSGAIWQSVVIYSDGMITVDFCKLKQIKNPDKWNQKHDWVKSRHCGCQIGYPEYGTWNHNRVHLSHITGVFKSYEEYKLAEKKCKDKYGGFLHNYLFRPLPCKLIKDNEH
jgi:hypothetical protein